MKVLKTRLIMGAATVEMDTVEYQGKFWLVPLWLDSPSEGMSTPARIVLMDPFEWAPFEGGFHLSRPVPAFVLEGRVPPELAKLYVVIERPPLYIRRGH